MARKIKINYIPRPWQKRLHKECAKKRFAILSFHRRCGKSVFAVAEMINTLLTFNKLDEHGNPFKNPKCLWVSKTIGQAERSIWLYLKDMLADVPDIKFNITKHEITFPHPKEEFGTCTIRLFGSLDPDSIRGDYCDLAVLDEVSSFSPEIYNKVVVPMVSDRSGKILLISTPAGTNAFYKLFMLAKSKPHSWVAEKMDVYESGVIPPEELELIKDTITDEAWRQEYLVDWFAVPAGYFFAREMQDAEKENRITNISYDPRYPVHTSWDLGRSDDTSIVFFQKVGNTFNYIDCLENRSKGLEFYVEELQKRGYRYGKHFLPHDSKVKELSTNRDRLSYLREFGLKNIIVVPKTTSLMEVIHLTRQFIPICNFDKVKCERLIDCLKAYQRKYSAKTDSFEEKPMKTNMIHMVDSFRTYAQIHGANYLDEVMHTSNSFYDQDAEAFDPFETGETSNEKDSFGRDFFNQYRNTKPYH